MFNGFNDAQLDSYQSYRPERGNLHSKKNQNMSQWPYGSQFYGHNLPSVIHQPSQFWAPNPSLIGLPNFVPLSSRCHCGQYQTSDEPCYHGNSAASRNHHYYPKHVPVIGSDADASGSKGSENVPQSQKQSWKSDTYNKPSPTYMMPPSCSMENQPQYNAEGRAPFYRPYMDVRPNTETAVEGTAKCSNNVPPSNLPSNEIITSPSGQEIMLLGQDKTKSATRSAQIDISHSVNINHCENNPKINHSHSYVSSNENSSHLQTVVDERKTYQNFEPNCDQSEKYSNFQTMFYKSGGEETSAGSAVSKSQKSVPLKTNDNLVPSQTFQGLESKSHQPYDPSKCSLYSQPNGHFDHRQANESSKSTDCSNYTLGASSAVNGSQVVKNFHSDSHASENDRGASPKAQFDYSSYSQCSRVSATYSKTSDSTSEYGKNCALFKEPAPAYYGPSCKEDYSYHKTATTETRYASEASKAFESKVVSSGTFYPKPSFDDKTSKLAMEKSGVSMESSDFPYERCNYPPLYNSSYYPNSSMVQYPNDFLGERSHKTNAPDHRFNKFSELHYQNFNRSQYPFHKYVPDRMLDCSSRDLSALHKVPYPSNHVNDKHRTETDLFNSNRTHLGLNGSSMFSMHNNARLAYEGSQQLPQSSRLRHPENYSSFPPLLKPPDIHQYSSSQPPRNIYTEQLKNDETKRTNKISPLRLMRKKKLIDPNTRATIHPTNLENGGEIGSSSSGVAPNLDLRRFLATWADEEEDNLGQTQMVVLDCQNIEPEQAELLRLCDNPQIRTIHVDGNNVVSFKEPTSMGSGIDIPDLGKTDERTNQDSVVPPKESVVSGVHVGIGQADQMAAEHIPRLMLNPHHVPSYSDCMLEKSEHSKTKAADMPVVETSLKFSNEASEAIEQGDGNCKNLSNVKTEEPLQAYGSSGDLPALQTKKNITNKTKQVGGRPSEEKREKKRGSRLSHDTENRAMDKWTEKKFGFIRRAEEIKAAENKRNEEERKKIFELSKLTKAGDLSTHSSPVSDVIRKEERIITREENPSSSSAIEKTSKSNTSEEDHPTEEERGVVQNLCSFERTSTPKLPKVGREEELEASPNNTPSTLELPTSEYRKNKFLEYTDTKDLSCKETRRLACENIRKDSEEERNSGNGKSPNTNDSQRTSLLEPDPPTPVDDKNFDCNEKINNDKDIENERLLTQKSSDSKISKKSKKPKLKNLSSEKFQIQESRDLKISFKLLKKDGISTEMQKLRKKRRDSYECSTETSSCQCDESLTVELSPKSNHGVPPLRIVRKHSDSISREIPVLRIKKISPSSWNGDSSDHGKNEDSIDFSSVYSVVTSDPEELATKKDEKNKDGDFKIDQTVQSNRLKITFKRKQKGAIDLSVHATDGTKNPDSSESCRSDSEGETLKQTPKTPQERDNDSEDNHTSFEKTDTVRMHINLEESPKMTSVIVPNIHARDGSKMMVSSLVIDGEEKSDVHSAHSEIEESMSILNTKARDVEMEVNNRSTVDNGVFEKVPSENTDKPSGNNVALEQPDELVEPKADCETVVEPITSSYTTEKTRILLDQSVISSENVVTEESKGNLDEVEKTSSCEPATSAKEEHGQTDMVSVVSPKCSDSGVTTEISLASSAVYEQKLDEREEIKENLEPLEITKEDLNKTDESVNMVSALHPTSVSAEVSSPCQDDVFMADISERNLFLADNSSEPIDLALKSNCEQNKDCFETDEIRKSNELVGFKSPINLEKTESRESGLELRHENSPEVVRNLLPEDTIEDRNSEECSKEDNPPLCENEKESLTEDLTSTRDEINSDDVLTKRTVSVLNDTVNTTNDQSEMMPQGHICDRNYNDELVTNEYCEARSPKLDVPKATEEQVESVEHVINYSCHPDTESPEGKGVSGLINQAQTDEEETELFESERSNTTDENAYENERGGPELALDLCVPKMPEKLPNLNTFTSENSEKVDECTRDVEEQLRDDETSSPPLEDISNEMFTRKIIDREDTNGNIIPDIASSCGDGFNVVRQPPIVRNPKCRLRSLDTPKCIVCVPKRPNSVPSNILFPFLDELTPVKIPSPNFILDISEIPLPPGEPPSPDPPSRTSTPLDPPTPPTPTLRESPHCESLGGPFTLDEPLESSPDVVQSPPRTPGRECDTTDIDERGNRKRAPSPPSPTLSDISSQSFFSCFEICESPFASSTLNHFRNPSPPAYDVDFMEIDSPTCLTSRKRNENVPYPGEYIRTAHHPHIKRVQSDFEFRNISPSSAKFSTDSPSTLVSKIESEDFSSTPITTKNDVSVETSTEGVFSFVELESDNVSSTSIQKSDPDVPVEEEAVKDQETTVSVINSEELELSGSERPNVQKETSPSEEVPKDTLESSSEDKPLDETTIEEAVELVQVVAESAEDLSSIQLCRPEQIDSECNDDGGQFYMIETLDGSENVISLEASEEDPGKNTIAVALNETVVEQLRIGQLKLFSCSVEDLMTIEGHTDEIVTAEDNFERIDHTSRDVLLSSYKDPPIEELTLCEENKSTETFLEFSETLVEEAGSELCPELLPVDNWPYVEEEVPLSPTHTKNEDVLLSPPLENVSGEIPVSSYPVSKIPDSQNVLPSYFNSHSFLARNPNFFIPSDSFLRPSQQPSTEDTTEKVYNTRNKGATSEDRSRRKSVASSRRTNDSFQSSSAKRRKTIDGVSGTRSPRRKIFEDSSEELHEDEAQALRLQNKENSSDSETEKRFKVRVSLERIGLKKNGGIGSTPWRSPFATKNWWQWPYEKLNRKKNVETFKNTKKDKRIDSESDTNNESNRRRESKDSGKGGSVSSNQIRKNSEESDLVSPYSTPTSPCFESEENVEVVSLDDLRKVSSQSMISSDDIHSPKWQPKVVLTKIPLSSIKRESILIKESKERPKVDWVCKTENKHTKRLENHNRDNRVGHSEKNKTSNKLKESPKSESHVEKDNSDLSKIEKILSNTDKDEDKSKPKAEKQNVNNCKQKFDSGPGKVLLSIDRSKIDLRNTGIIEKGENKPKKSEAETTAEIESVETTTKKRKSTDISPEQNVTRRHDSSESIIRKKPRFRNLHTKKKIVVPETASQKEVKKSNIKREIKLVSEELKSLDEKASKKVKDDVTKETGRSLEARKSLHKAKSNHDMKEDSAGRPKESRKSSSQEKAKTVNAGNREKKLFSNNSPRPERMKKVDEVITEQKNSTCERLKKAEEETPKKKEVDNLSGESKKSVPENRDVKLKEKRPSSKEATEKKEENRNETARKHIQYTRLKSRDKEVPISNKDESKQEESSLDKANEKTKSLEKYVQKESTKSNSELKKSFSSEKVSSPRVVEISYQKYRSHQEETKLSDNQRVDKNVKSKSKESQIEEKLKDLTDEGSDNENIPWVCEVCDFKDESERVNHIKEHSFHCQSCHLAFKTELHFITHLTKKHRDIRKQHHCLLCELSFNTAEEHQEHLDTRNHKHLESVEKNTINTLFTVLTGQPCPVLGPLEVRPEWLPNQAGTVHFYHQATPLSLALQYLKMRQDGSSQLQDGSM